MLPFILWWLIRQHLSGLRAGLQRALLFCIGTIVIISPTVYRNYQISGVPLLRSQATWSLYSGLAPEFEGLHPPVGILFDKYMHQPLQAGYRTEKEIEQYWGKKLVETIREEPLAVAANLIRRLAIFFNAREWSQEFDVSAYRAYSWFLSLTWDADSPYHIGRIMIQRGQKEQGLELLNEALRREPHFPEALIAIARVELSEGRLLAAERRIRNSLQYNPTEKDALLLLADIRRRQGNRAEEIALLKQAVLETKHAPAAMLVADRLVDMGKYGDAVYLYRLVSASSDTERYLRVQAAMKVGFTSARFMPDDADIRGYWKAVARDYDDFTFLSLQARFLSGSIDGGSFERQMNRNAEWKAAGAYAIGLKHWLNGNIIAARVAFERCLRVDDKKTARPESIPQKWAWEDLNRLRLHP